MKTEWTSTRVSSHWVWMSSFCEAVWVRDGSQTHNPLLGLHSRDIIAQCDKCFAEMNSCLLRWSENTLTINRCITVADCQAFGWRGHTDERGLLYCLKAAVVIIELTESYYVWIQVRLSKQEKVFTCIIIFFYFPILRPCVLPQLPQELSLVFPMQWALLNILNRKCLFFPQPIHTFMKRPKAFSDQGREGKKKKGFWSWALLNIDKKLFGVGLEKLHADMFICTFLAT